MPITPYAAPQVVIGRQTPGVTIVSSGQTPQVVYDAFIEVSREQMEAAMRIVQTFTVRLIPRRSGHGARSISYRVDYDAAQDIFTGTVGSSLNYLGWIDRGTGIYGPHKHPIVPTHKQALHFPTPGNRAFTAVGRQRRGAAGRGAGWVTVRSVKGVKPQKFFERAIESSRSQWVGELHKIAPLAKARLAQKAKRAA